MICKNSATVLQQLKQKHPNDPQLDQLNTLLLPQQLKKEFIVFMRISQIEVKLTCCK